MYLYFCVIQRQISWNSVTDNYEIFADVLSSMMWGNRQQNIVAAMRAMMVLWFMGIVQNYVIFEIMKNQLSSQRLRVIRRRDDNPYRPYGSEPRNYSHRKCGGFLLGAFEPIAVRQYCTFSCVDFWTPTVSLMLLCVIIRSFEYGFWFLSPCFTGFSSFKTACCIISNGFNKFTK